MKKSRFAEEQIAFALRHAGGGDDPQTGDRRADVLPLEEKVWGLGVAEVRRIKQLEKENHKLKQLVADLSLDKRMLQDVLSKKL